MNLTDFNNLTSLLSKLETTTDKAAQEDVSFRKYHSNSINSLKGMKASLKSLELGLKTANLMISED